MTPRRALALTALSTALALACGSGDVPRPVTPRDQTEPQRNSASLGEARVGEVVEAAAEAPPETPPAQPPGPREVTIGASGDLLVHLKVIRSAEEQRDVGGYLRVLGDLRTVIGEDEVAFANLETPLSMRVDPETGNPPVMGAPADVAPALAAVGIDVVSVANNHSYDQTAAGLDDTLEALRSASVASVGAGRDTATEPWRTERDGVRVAFVAFTERVNRGPATQGPHPSVARFDEESARSALAQAREGADVVVLSIHWSHDFIDSPRIAQRRLARMLVDAGADLIVGHGPHVLQEVERMQSPRGDAVVAYSLGNLLSNQGMRYWAGRRIPENVHPAVVIPEVRDGAWLRARFAVDDDRLRVAALEAVPLWTRNNFMDVALHRADVLDIGASPLRAASEEIQAERRPIIGRALGDAVTLLP